MFSGVFLPFPTLRKCRSGRSERSAGAKVQFVPRFYTAWTQSRPLTIASLLDAVDRIIATIGKRVGGQCDCLWPAKGAK